MPTNRTKRTRNRAGLDHWKIDQLLTGECLLAGVGYAAMHRHGCNNWTEEEQAQVHEAMRADWRQDGAAFMAWWRGETEAYTAVYGAVGGERDTSVTPWALTEFGQP